MESGGYRRKRSNCSHSGDRNDRTDGNHRGYRRKRSKETTAREIAVSILSAVDSRSAFSDRLLSSYLKEVELSPEDRNLLTYLVKGTLRWRGRLDWVLSGLLKTELADLPTWIRNVLRLGAFQILFMDRIPVSAATNESVKLARKRGHPGTAGLVNAVLRRLVSTKDAIQYPSIEKDAVAGVSILYSHPEWIVKRWLQRFGLERTIRICEANNSSDYIFIRPNRTRVEPATLMTRLREKGIAAELCNLNPSMIKVSGELAPATDSGFRAGLYTPQDEGESLVCCLLSVENAGAFLDLCAGPGGKATQLAEMTSDARPVYCLELHHARSRQVQEAARRLGLSSIGVVTGDGRVAPFKGKFERILVDAPCSGLGVIGKRADARWRKKETSLASLSELQKELLDSASELLDEKGVLVYSVCSFEQEETSEVVSSFLNSHRDLEIESASGLVDESLVDESGAMLILPDRYGTDGLFAARMRKVR
jgi:16S rRNA (cytosine967-C5)-methyltransferase